MATWNQITPGDLHYGLGVARAIGFQGGRQHIYFLKRVGTKDDSEIPRVVAGAGQSHADAMTAVVEEVARYDRAARIAWADDPQHPAQQARTRSLSMSPDG